MADSHLDLRLKVDRSTIPPIPDDFYSHFKNIKETQPKHIMPKLMSILSTRPDSDVQRINTRKTDYATWIKKQSRREPENWDQYSDLRYDPDHDTIWAIIAAKMFSILRHSSKKDIDFTDYSAQYLLDFAPPPRKVNEGKQKVARKKQRICCKPRSVAEGLEYVLHNKLPRERDWKYVGCRHSCKQANVLRFAIDGEIFQSNSLRVALYCLKSVPVAAKLHTFEPDLGNLVETEIYHGPKYVKSRYTGLKDVMIYATEIVDGELVASVNLPCKKMRRLHVSLDVMLVQTPRDDEDVEPHKELATPTYLVTNFCAITL